MDVQDTNKHIFLKRKLLIYPWMLHQNKGLCSPETTDYILSHIRLFE